MCRLCVRLCGCGLLCFPLMRPDVDFWCGITAAAKPQRAGGRPQHLQLQQPRQGLRSGCWHLQGPKGGLGCNKPRGGLEDLVPEPLIRRLPVGNQVSRRVPHGYRIVLRVFPSR